MGKLFGVVAAVMAVIVLAIASAAGAYDWGWSGDVPPGNGACPQYTSEAACSPWNYYYQENYNLYLGSYTLFGFENNSVIRGVYAQGTNQSGTVYASDLGMGGQYIRGHGTYCDWTGMCYPGSGDSYIWFRAYA